MSSEMKPSAEFANLCAKAGLSEEAMVIASAYILHDPWCDPEMTTKCNCTRPREVGDLASSIDALIATRLTAAESSLAEARARVAELERAVKELSKSRDDHRTDSRNAGSMLYRLAKKPDRYTHDEIMGLLGRRKSPFGIVRALDADDAPLSSGEQP